MLSVAAVRFVLLPCATVVLVLAVQRAGLLPPDPACAFMLLLQSCMPPGEIHLLLLSCGVVGCVMTYITACPDDCKKTLDACPCK